MYSDENSLYDDDEFKLFESFDALPSYPKKLDHHYPSRSPSQDEADPDTEFLVRVRTPKNLPLNHPSPQHMKLRANLKSLPNDTVLNSIYRLDFAPPPINGYAMNPKTVAEYLKDSKKLTVNNMSSNVHFIMAITNVEYFKYILFSNIKVTSKHYCEGQYTCSETKFYGSTSFSTHFMCNDEVSRIDWLLFFFFNEKITL